jgi:hypothetical protein
MQQPGEKVMRRHLVMLTAATLIGGGLIMGGHAQAAQISAPGAIRAAVDGIDAVQHIQFVYLGRRYCWYDDGWHGPGWYWCNYAWRSGIGWGGGFGWRGWRWHGGRYWGGGGHVAGGRVSGGRVSGGRVSGGRVSGGRVSGGRVSGGRVSGGGVSGGRVSGGGGRGGGGGGRGGGGGGRGGGGGGHRSDIRLKEDIVALGRLNSGLGIYRFHYKGNDHTTYVGVMAQEVQNVRPDAVSRDADGYLRVNYDRLGLKFSTWDAWLARTGGKLTRPQ